MKIKLTDLTIPDRFRKEYGDLERLGNSLLSLGQIQPILVTKVNAHWELVAGGRRCAAAKLVNIEALEAWERENLTELQRKELEFEENNPLTRKDMEWWEQCISVAEMHEMKSIEHGFSIQGGDADAWTQQKMAAFAGTSVGRLNYMLRLARLLKATPRTTPPEGVWAHAESYQDGVKYLISLHEAEVNAELDRRRKLANPQIVAATAVVDGATGEPIHEMNGLEVQPVDSANPIIYISGIAGDFADIIIPGRTPEMATTILALDPPEAAFPAIKACLRPNGYAILWFHSFARWTQYKYLTEGHVFSMGYPLIWNRIKVTDKGDWAFAQTTAFGLVLTKGLHAQVDTPQQSVVAAMLEDDDLLPSSVVEFSLRTLSAENKPVHCIYGVDPVTVAELARVPIWYEPDAITYERKYAMLKNYYEEIIPGVVVKTYAK